MNSEQYHQVAYYKELRSRAIAKLMSGHCMSFQDASARRDETEATEMLNAAADEARKAEQDAAADRQANTEAKWEDR